MSLKVEEIAQKIQDLDFSDKLEKIKEDLKSINQEIANFTDWSDQEKNIHLQSLKAEKEKEKFFLESILNDFEDLKIAKDLEEESISLSLLAKISQKIQDFENNSFLNGRFDSNSAFLSIYSGAGGVDAEDFSAMLMSMYQSFCKKNNFKCKVLDFSAGKEGGLKSATLDISGLNAYGFLSAENGVHRLIRISPFNSGSTRETSFAGVEVLPQGLEESFEGLSIKEEDLKIDCFLAGGKGGQGVNTTYSAVRITHLPTGITASCQNERNQIQNKDQAKKVLLNKLAILEMKKKQEYLEDFKGISPSIEWGSQIRSYTLHPYKLVKDHRSNYEINEPEKVFDGSALFDIIWSVKKLKK